MRKKILFFVMMIMIGLIGTACSDSPEECDEGEVRDKRFRTLPPDTFGMCIPRKKGEDTETWCTGTVENGQCRSELKAGESCYLVSDCGEAAPTCLGDPMVIDMMMSSVDLDAETAALITPENLRTMGMAICTVTECDTKGGDDVCTNGTVCRNAFEQLPVMRAEEESAALYICMKDDSGDSADTGDTGDSADTGNTGDSADTGDTGDTGDTADDPACLGDECASHDECKTDGCEATFCTAGLAENGLTDLSVCAYRCDPENGDSDCADGGLPGYECNDASAAEIFGVELDGAKGICAPPEE